MKILIADDDATSRLLLAATLKKLGHEVTAVVDGAAAWTAWQRDEYPVVISDWMMPGLDGPGLCREIRAAAPQHYTYIILLTSLDGRGRYLGGMEAGADDFVTKPFDEDYLAARLHAAQRILALHETLRMEASHDHLTGLLNRGAILELVQQELVRSQREGGCVGLVLGDLDRFKHINDSHGHAAGDSVLKEAARRMQACLRPYDRVGRYGGEEFLVMTPGCGPDHALTVAERVRAAIAATPIPAGAGSLPVTISLGVAVSQPGDTNDVNALIGAADTALYQAKAAGRDRVVLAEAVPARPVLPADSGPVPDIAAT